MAKGLSALQKKIISNAYLKGIRTFEGDIGGLCNGDHSGFIIWSLEALDACYEIRGDKERVSICRALNRLEKRGLAEHIQKGLLGDYRTGIILTDAGIEQTKS